MDYKSSGVDLVKADMLTELIAKSVSNKNIGMFAGLYEHPVFKDYYLAACCDGVGTKIIPLLENGMTDSIAQDLIAMNLNDLICLGAKPLFFLDYIAANKIEVELLADFVNSLKQKLKQFDCLLLGGETAELGDLVKENHFDVAGFAVGAVKKTDLLNKENVCENDIVIGLCSSGPHSNGFSLVRKLYNDGLLSEELFKESLKPTHIFVNEIAELVEKGLVKTVAHITGGGIEGNLCRVIPDGLQAEVLKKNIPQTKLFKALLKLISQEEAYKVFNMGVGMCIIAEEKNKDTIFKICEKYAPFEFGRIVKNEESSRVWLR
ncbi:MAG: phosphoribosylformylglycinamidine cyclo-ligase [bacterium]